MNVTPPPTVTTTSAPEDVYSTSQLSLVIDKADSIEEKDESTESVPQKRTFSNEDVVIEEDLPVPSELTEVRERKLSVVTSENRRSVDVEDCKVREPFEASIPPPTTTSTQTVPTEEFPEASVTSSTINQADDVGTIAQLNVETQQDMRIAHEIDTNEMRSSCTRSTNEGKDESSESGAMADESEKSISAASRACDEQLKQSVLAQQQSMSQEEDYEVAMVSGLLPGCVAPAPTPAPSIAPLAETEADTAEDDVDNVTEQCEEPKPEVERKKKRKERKETEGGESQAQADAESSSDPEKSKRNAVCPWEDE